jgi:hypothetical protein
MANHKQKSNGASRFTGATKRLSTAGRDVWAEYEARKRAWVALNGRGDSAAYDAMIRRVCNELGL